MTFLFLNLMTNNEVSVPAANCDREAVCGAEMHSTMDNMGVDGVTGQMDQMGESTMGTSSNGANGGRKQEIHRTRGFCITQNKRRNIPPSFRVQQMKRPMAKRTGPSLLQIWTYARHHIVHSPEYKQIIQDFRTHLADLTFQYDQHREKFPARIARFSPEETLMNALDDERHYEVCRAQIHAWDALFQYWPKQFVRFIRDCHWAFLRVFPNGYNDPNKPASFYPRADPRFAELHAEYMKVIPPQFKVFFGVFMETSASY